MRILVVSIGTYGDVLPFIGLAAELTTRGHDVTMSTAETFEIAVRRAGVAFEPLMSAEDYENLFEHPDFWRPFRGGRRLFSSISAFFKPTYDFIAKRNRAGETLVLASSLALGARVAEEALGVPTVTVHLTPIMFASRYEPTRVPYMRVPSWLPKWLKWKLQTGLYSSFIAKLLLADLNAFRATVGLPRLKKIRKWWHARAGVLLLAPDWFAPAQPDWPKRVRQLGFPRADQFGARFGQLDERLRAFLDAGEPPVAVTFGSARFGSTKLYRAAIEACARIGRRCLVLSHQPLDLPPDLARIAFAAQYAPLGDVLPRCSALVHHGGVGTTALVFGAGVPQLIVPMAFDQFDHAERVRRLGCGDTLPRRRFSADRAAATLGRLIASGEVADRCAEAAAACKGVDAIGEACDVLEAEFCGLSAPRRAAGCV
jgi:UDP:flavonoid glycosyltransferase YjiC (YdhE family)